MGIIEPAYKAVYQDVILIPDATGGYKLKDGWSVSPFYPIFLEADISTFEGFQRFITEAGLRWFTYLDGKDVKYSLGDTLKELMRRPRKDRVMSVSYLKRFHERVKDRLQDEQEVIKLFHLWFIEGKQPHLHRGDGKAYPAFWVYQNQITGYPFKPKNKDEEKIFEAVRRIETALDTHLKSVHLYSRMNVHWAVTFDPAKQSPRDFLSVRFEPQSFPAVCYLEMLAMIEDGKKARKCALCGRLFIASHDREIFCNRRPPGLDLNRPWEEIRDLTCKDVGPQERFWKNKSKEDIERIREKKSWQNRLLYLKKTGQKDEYDKKMKEFELWQTGIRKSKGGSHGKKTRKG